MKKKGENTEPKSFIMYLRKNLKTSFIKKIEQIPNERIIKFELSKIKEGVEKTFILFIEIFSGGNIILCDENLKILNLLNRKNFKDRTLKVYENYTLPPQKKISYLNLNIENFKKNLNDEIIIKTLSNDLGMGGKFSNEILFRCKIKDKTISNTLNSLEIKKIINIIKNILNEKINPHFSEDDFFPIEFLSKKNLKKINTFNNLLKTYFLKYEIKKSQKELDFDKEIKSLKNRIKKLEEQKEEINFKYEEQNKLGNLIYENYELIENILKNKKYNEKEVLKFYNKKGEIEIKLN